MKTTRKPRKTSSNLRNKKKPNSPAPLTFALLNDLHYINRRCAAHLARVVRTINSLKPQPAFVMVLGDLVEHASPASLRAVKRILQQLKAPLHTVPGNHDYHPAHGLAHYEKIFPNSANYTFTHANFQFIALDTCTSTGYQNIRSRPETLAFLRQTIPTLNPQLPTILLTHFPLHRSVKYSLANPASILAPLSKLNLVATFGGHFHGTTTNRYKSTPLHTCVCISRSREIHDGSSQKGFLLVTATPQKINPTFIPHPVS